MYSKFITEQEFIASFKFRKNVTYKQFAKELSFLKRSATSLTDTVTAVDHFTKNNSHDRLKRLPVFTKNLYKLLVQEPEEFLGTWFRHFGTMTEDFPFYFQMENTPIYSGGDAAFLGNYNAKYGRICRQLNFEAVYNTKKTNNDILLYQNHMVLDLLHAMFEEFALDVNIAIPMFYNKVCDLTDPKDGYMKFWKFLMTFLPKPSILNPYTYREILNTLFEGETVFAPCMSWNSPQLAFYSTNFTHFISTDVIPSVVENGKTLHLDWQDWNNNRACLFPEDKTIDLYCCPSEQLQKRHKFIDKYRNKVDAVLFCPPYFDLELYDGGEQSTESFPDYDEWLKGYWEETVKTCAAVMKSGARFGFIASNYKKGKTWWDVSDDMGEVCKNHFRLVKKYKILWSSFEKKTKTGKHEEGNYEDLWLFEKR